MMSRQQSLDEDTPLPDAPECLLCASAIAHYAVTPCGHSGSICGRCVTNMIRFTPAEAKGRPLKCPFCKVDWNAIVFTAEKKGFEACQPLKRSFYNPHLRVYADTPEIYQRFNRSTSIFCKHCDKNGKQTRFKSLRQLTSHLEREHNLYLCLACIHARRLPIEQARLYTKTALTKHFRNGTPATDDEPAIAPHPFCHFCKEPYFSKDELFAHMESKHLQCAFCNRNNVADRIYFRNRHKLRCHYREEHYLCEQPECVGLGHDVAFDNEVDLKSHNLAFHIDTSRMTRSERNRASRIQFGVLAGSSTSGRGGRLNRRNRRIRGDRDIAFLSLESDDEDGGAGRDNAQEVSRVREELRRQLEQRYRKAAAARARSNTPPHAARKPGEGGAPGAASASAGSESGIERSHSVPAHMSAASASAASARLGADDNNNSAFPALGGAEAHGQPRHNLVYQRVPVASEEAFPSLPSALAKASKRPNNRSKGGRRDKKKPPPPQQQPSNNSLAHAQLPGQEGGSLSVGPGESMPQACPSTLLRARNEYFQKTLRGLLGGDEEAYNDLRRAVALWMKGGSEPDVFVATYRTYCKDFTPLRDLVSLVRAHSEEKAFALWSAMGSVGPNGNASRGDVWDGKKKMNPHELRVLYAPPPGLANGNSAKPHDKGLLGEHKGKQTKKVLKGARKARRCNECTRPLPDSTGAFLCAACSLSAHIPKAQPPPSSAGAPVSEYSPGQRVFAMYASEGTWYHAVVERPGGEQGTFVVRYDGYGNLERLGLDQLRPILSAASTPAAGSADKNWKAVKTESVKKKKQNAAAFAHLRETKSKRPSEPWQQEGMVDPSVLRAQISELLASQAAGVQLLVLSVAHEESDKLLQQRGVGSGKAIRAEMTSGKRTGIIDLTKRPNFHKRDPQLLLALGTLRTLGFKESSFQYLSQVSRMVATEKGCGSRVRQWIATSLTSMSTSDLCLLHQFSQMVLLRAVAEEEVLASAGGNRAMIVGASEVSSETADANSSMDDSKGGKKKKKKKKKKVLLL